MMIHFRRITAAMGGHGTVRLRGNKYLYSFCIFAFCVLFYKIQGGHLFQSREEPFVSLHNKFFNRVQYVVSKRAHSQPRKIVLSLQVKQEILQLQQKRPQNIFNETELVHSGKEDLFVPPINNQNLSYLKLTNTFYHNASVRYTPANERYIIEDTIRTGFNLEPCASGWRENGIEYRPKIKPRPVSGGQGQDDDDTDYEAHVPFDENVFFQGKRVSRREHTKIILWHSPSTYTNTSPNLYFLSSCPYFPCAVTTERTLYQNISSAVIFPAESITGHPPTRTTRDQIFIFHNTKPYTSAERLLKDFSKPAWTSVFNWTLTYRLDSDIVLPYGVVRRRPQPLKAKNYDKIVAGKRRFVAFITNDCQTSAQPDLYVQKLQNYMPVDVIGKCGNIKYENLRGESYADWIAREYKFVLAFESALCPDYVTEKLFYFLKKDIVVVARGSDDYFLHLPSETFINTDDFSTRVLANVLHYLNRNKDAYIDLLREKDQYMVIFEEHAKRTPSGAIEHKEYLFSGVPMCQICHRLWNLEMYAKKIDDIHGWFDGKICRYPTDLAS